MLRSVMQKRKRWKLPVMFLFTSMLLGCQSSKELEESSGSTSYLKETVAKEDCLVCGDSEGTMLSLHKGEENIGVISLNTFELAHVEINRYDDYGNLLEEPSQETSTRRTSTGEGGFAFMATGNTDRGYAMCDLYFNNDEFLDVEQAATHMCTECLGKAIDDGFGDDPTGMAIINFSTGEVRMLRENLIAFQCGDFYPSCESKRYKTEENTLKMNLLVFYCPRRYGD